MIYFSILFLTLFTENKVLAQAAAAPVAGSVANSANDPTTGSAPDAPTTVENQKNEGRGSVQIEINTAPEKTEPVEEEKTPAPITEKFDEFSQGYYQMLTDAKRLIKQKSHSQAMQILAPFLESLRQRLKLSHTHRNHFEFADGGIYFQQLQTNLTARKKNFSWDTISISEQNTLLNLLFGSLPPNFIASLVQYKIAYMVYLDALVATLKTSADARLSLQLFNERILPDLMFLYATPLIFKGSRGQKPLVLFDSEISDRFRQQIYYSRLLDFVLANSVDLQFLGSPASIESEFLAKFNQKLMLQRIYLLTSESK